MAQYDGAIRIVTKITTKDAEESLSSLEFTIKKSAKYMDELRSKMDTLKGQKIPTQEYKNLQDDLANSQKELSKLIEEQEKYNQLGITSGGAWNALNEKIAQSSDSIDSIKEKIQSLVESGKDFTLGENTAEYAKYAQQLQYEEEAIVNAGEKYKELMQKTPEYIEKQAAAQKKIEEQAERALQRENAKIQKQAEIEAKLQAQEAKEQRLADIKENATVADKELVDLLERRIQLLEKIRDLERAGVTEGYQEYDTAFSDLADVQSQINRIRDMRDAAAEARASYKSMGEVARETFRAMARGLIDIPIAAVKTAVNGLVSGFQKLGTVARNVAVKSFRLLGTSIKSALSKTGSLIGNMVSKLKILGSTAKKSFGDMNRSAKRTGGTMGTIASRFKGLMLSFLLFNQISKALNGSVKAIKEGFSNLYKDNERFQNSVNELKASVLTLKNAFAAAFRPLVDVAIPYIQMAADKLTDLLNKVGQFTAAITGQKTYTKAIKQTADAFKEVKKAAESYLSPLDEINRYSDGKKDEDEVQFGVMFEELPIEQKFKDFANKLKDMWAKSDFSDLGKTFGEKIKNSLDNIPWEEIKEKAGKVGKSLASLLNGFIEVDSLGYSIGKTLAEAINTGFEFLNNFVHELHWDSLGKFIADTLNGLFQNIDWELIYDTFITGAKGLGDAINSFVDNLDWGTISTTIANFVNTFVDTVYTFFTTVDWSKLGKKIGETLSETIKKIDFEKVGRAIGSVIQAAINFVKNLISELSFDDIVNAIKDTLKGLFEEADWTEIAKIALSLLVGALITQSSTLKLAAVALAILTAFQDELIALDWKKAGEEIGKYFIKFFDFLTETIENIKWYELGQKVKEFIIGIPWNEVADAFFEAVGAIFGGLASFLWGIIEDAWNSVVQWWHDTAYEDGQFTIQGLLDGIVQAVSDIANWVKQHIFQPFIDGFRNAFGIHSPSTVMLEMGTYIIEGMLNGILDAFKNIGSWLKEHVFNPFMQGFKSAFGIHSPSTVMKEMGGYIIEGMLNGILQALKSIASWLKTNVFNPFINGFKSAFGISSDSSAMRGIGKSVIEGFLNGLKNAWSNITTWVGEKIQWIIDKFKGIKDEISGFFSGGGGSSGSTYSTQSYSMRSISSPYATNPAFAALSAAPIPKLATGAVIPANREFLAVLGDQKHGTNVEAPLETIKQAQVESLLEVFSRLGLTGSMGNSNPQTIVIKQYLDGKQVAESVVREGKIQQMVTGNNMFSLGTT